MQKQDWAMAQSHIALFKKEIAPMDAQLLFLKKRFSDCSFDRSFEKRDCSIALFKKANEKKLAKIK